MAWLTLCQIAVRGGAAAGRSIANTIDFAEMGRSGAARLLTLADYDLLVIMSMTALQVLLTHWMEALPRAPATVCGRYRCCGLTAAGRCELSRVYERPQVLRGEPELQVLLGMSLLVRRP